MPENIRISVVEIPYTRSVTYISQATEGRPEFTKNIIYVRGDARVFLNLFMNTVFLTIQG